MEKAILKSIEGGWEYRGIKSSNFVEVQEGSLDNDVVIVSKFNKYLVQNERILLDPKFWQCLGKSLGWEGTEEEPEWLENWHDFINHLAEGKDINLFFEEIIKTK